ncbi:hypothetical protein B7L28_00110 [Veillonella atypica]|uniref:AAA family ATPase n=1 Tax=Veillonella TaxID=29465 RepID=UPI0009E0ECAB|nr:MULTISPECIES: ATP-binding protein [Veillonella]ARF98441.1 hypothetical protein B7L28_00110 [Veillonella atypica]PQL23974.1 ATP-binding protein [Veillonella sp. T34266-5]
MLLDFTFKNVRSFKNETSFSMEVGEGISRLVRKNTHHQKGIRLLKSAYILGGNATGKTNLIYALDILKMIILSGTSSELNNLFTDTYAANKEDTEFHIKFYKNGKQFDYLLIYNFKQVKLEILKVNKKLIFSRNHDELVVPSLLKGIKDTLRNNQPLLYFAQNNNVLEAKEAYEWFGKDLVSPRLVGIPSIDQQIFKPLLENNSLKEDTLYFLKAADFNIVDIKVSESVYESNADFKEKRLQVDFVHQGDEGNSFVLNWTAESTGTKIFIMLSMYILQRAYRNSVFLIDEFDRSLHPKLVILLIRLFNEYNEHNQFIVTTHNNEIINNNLRLDQIWFVDKNYQGISELYNAFDFDEKPTMNQVKKNYQDGLYGGDQIINEGMLLDILGKQHG